MAETVEFIDFKKIQTSDYLHLQIKNREVEMRPAQDIIAVVDVSGSMSTLAQMKSTEGVVEHGLSILDIVKHSLKTIIESLNEKDRFSLIVFSTEAKMIYPLDFLTKENKTKLYENIEVLRPSGSTNLWDGLYKAMEEYKTSDIGHNQNIILLTDGVPNIMPPRGHEGTLIRYLEKNKLNFSLYTCGFGYYLDSDLLVNLSNIANTGSYSFIPDSGMVGTIFINMMGNIFNQVANDLTITLPIEESYIDTKFNNYRKTKKGLEFKLSSLSNIQSQDLLIKLNQTLPDDIEITLKGNSLYFGPFEQIAKESLLIEEEINYQIARSNFCYYLNKSIKEGVLDKSFYVKVGELESNKKIDELIKDYNGQVEEAFSKLEYMTKWGKHYLPSLLQAHIQQKCNNFKDPGVQNYSDSEFLKYQDKLEDIFMKLPAPKPSIKTPGSVAAAKAGGTPMTSYYSCGNPCYHPNCTVKLESGITTKVKDLIKFDRVITPTGTASVRCVIKSKVKDKKMLMCHFTSGLIITPYHPIQNEEGQWNYPKDLIEPKETEVDFVVSVLLDSHHILPVCNKNTATFGHGFTGPVIYHDFFGTDKIVKHLMNHPTWEDGIIHLPEESIIRDTNTNLVCGFKWD